MTTLNDSEANALPPLRLPAEWEPQEGVMLAWPHRETDWEPLLQEAEACYTAIAREVARRTALVVVTPEPARARGLLQGAGIDDGHARIIYMEVPTNDTWARDFGPLTVELHGRPVPTDFTFNGWGLKFAADKDNMITRRLAADGLFSHPLRSRLQLVLEGGSVESDGRGTLLTTSECLLSPNRNPWLDKQGVESALHEALGATHILWLDHGHLAGDDTDSHIDTLARIAPEETIIYVGPPGEDDAEHHADLCNMRSQLRELRTPAGRPYSLIELPMADPAFDPVDGHRLPATYANYLVTEGAVLMPAYGNVMKDELAARMLRIAFPEREVVKIDCRALIRQHGSLHCVTMQLPAGSLAALSPK